MIQAMAPPRTATGLRPVERKRLTDLAHVAIRESIVTGAIGMGERLIETQLAADLGMSRAPIREALQRLAKEGLVTERPHQGAFVAEMTAADVADLYNVRLGIEGTTVRLFMHRDAPTDGLWSRIAAMERAADKGDVATVVGAEFDFHRHICELAGNALLSNLFAEQEGRLRLAIGLDDASFERLRDVAAEHVPLTEAIETGNQRRAVVVMEEHLLSTVGQLLGRLDGDASMLLGPLAATRRRKSAAPRTVRRG